MCLSNNFAPERPVTFFDTILYGAEFRTPAGEIEHVLGYFNKVKVTGAAPTASNPGSVRRGPVRSGIPSLTAPIPRQGRTSSDNSGDQFGWDKAPVVKKVGNAMLFAVPAVPGSMSAESLVPVSDIPSFMKDLKTAVTPRRPVMRGSRGIDFSLSAKSAPIVVKGFDKGTYDVVIAPSASSISKVIRQVSADKRPKSNAKLYKQLDALYPTWTFVLFCFSEQDAEQAGCALIKYKPQREDLLYLPGLDGHTGEIGWGPVDIAHTIVVGSHRLQPGPNTNQVRYSDDVSGHPYLFANVLGKVVTGQAPQGDFLCKIDEVRQGKFRCLRAIPPGAPKSVSRDPHYI